MRRWWVIVASLASRSAAVGAMMLSGCSTDAGDADAGASCREVALWEMNVERGCAHPWRAATEPCFRTAGDPKKDVGPVCLVGPDGRLYLARVSSPERITGTGWTHGAYSTVESTLSDADEARCERTAPSALDIVDGAGPMCEQPDAGDGGS